MDLNYTTIDARGDMLLVVETDGEQMYTRLTRFSECRSISHPVFMFMLMHHFTVQIPPTAQPGLFQPTSRELSTPSANSPDGAVPQLHPNMN